MLSITSPAIGFDVLVLFGVSLELMEVFSWILKVEPWSLGTNIEATHWVGGPAVAHSVVEVVWVSVGVVLVAIKTKIVSIEIVLWLKGLWKRASLLVSQVALEEEPWQSDSKESEHWESGILLGDHSVHERLLELLEESLGGHWLGEGHLVISWESMILDHSLQ